MLKGEIMGWLWNRKKKQPVEPSYRAVRTVGPQPTQQRNVVSEPLRDTSNDMLTGMVVGSLMDPCGTTGMLMGGMMGGVEGGIIGGMIGESMDCHHESSPAPECSTPDPPSCDTSSSSSDSSWSDSSSSSCDSGSSSDSGSSGTSDF